MATTTKLCSACGASFPCGASAAPCWCAALPAIMPLDFAQDCRCPPCLQTAIQERIARYVTTITPANAREAARSLAAQGGADGEPLEGLDYDVDERGSVVFSKWYLLRRGYCCENGCRNCPYGFERA